MNNSSLRVVISAGELSGDEHAAGLVRALQKLSPGIEFKGMGGPNLRLAGVDTVVDYETSGSIMGFSSVFQKLGTIRESLNRLKDLLNSWAPNLLIVVDYPDFNFRLIRHAKLLGIPVFYFIPPKVWAWRSGRVEFLKANVDAAALIFPHERAFLEARGFKNGAYVGHPFSESLKTSDSNESKREARSLLGLNSGLTAVALLPGSRKAEIEKLLPQILKAFKLLKAKHQNILGIIPAASPELHKTISAQIPNDSGIKITNGDAISVLRASDAGILKSGTSNLQAAFIGLPCAMFYQTGHLTAWFVRKVLKIKEYSPVNVVCPGSIREIVQEEVTEENIAEEIEKLLFNNNYRTQVKSNLAGVVAKLAAHDENNLFQATDSAYMRAARLGLKLIHG